MRNEQHWSSAGTCRIAAVSAKKGHQYRDGGRSIPGSVPFAAAQHAGPRRRKRTCMLHVASAECCQRETGERARVAVLCGAAKIPRCYKHRHPDRHQRKRCKSEACPEMRCVPVTHPSQPHPASHQSSLLSPQSRSLPRLRTRDPASYSELYLACFLGRDGNETEIYLWRGVSPRTRGVARMWIVCFSWAVHVYAGA